MKTILLLFGITILFTFISFGKQLARVGNAHYKVKAGKVLYCTPVNGLPMFHDEKEVVGADASSFKVFSFPYAKDKNHIYRHNEVIQACDPESFELIGSNKNYSKDKNAVFYAHQCISDDPENFELIEAGLGKDREHIYRFGHVVSGADVATFEVLGNGYYRDKNKVYMDVRYGLDGVKVVDSADPNNFNALADNQSVK